MFSRTADIHVVIFDVNNNHIAALINWAVPVSASKVYVSKPCQVYHLCHSDVGHVLRGAGGCKMRLGALGMFEMS